MRVSLLFCVCAAAATASTDLQHGELVAALTALQGKFEGLEGTVLALQTRVGLLEQENAHLRARAAAPQQAEKQQVPMSALGQAGDDGRRLSESTCCRWDAAGTCSGVSNARRNTCTHPVRVE